MPDALGQTEIKDFTTPQGTEPIPFKIDKDIFYAVPDVAIGRMAEIAKLRGNLSVENLDPIFNLFDDLLLDDSADLFKHRLTDKANPISQKHLLPLLEWLMEKYGMRPTQPSSTSSGLSENEDVSITSTDGASSMELTGSTLLQPAS